MTKSVIYIAAENHLGGKSPAQKGQTAKKGAKTMARTIPRDEIKRRMKEMRSEIKAVTKELKGLEKEAVRVEKQKARHTKKIDQLESKLMELDLKLTS